MTDITEKKRTGGMIAAGILCIVLIVAFFGAYWAAVRQITLSSIDSSMNSSARQASQTLAERFAGELRELETVAEIIESNAYSDPSLCAELLGCISQKEYCRSLGIITQDGTAYDTKGESYTFNGMELFASSVVTITGDVTGIITESYADTDGPAIHLFAVPVKLGALSSGYVYSIIEASVLRELLGTTSDNGYFCVTTADGSYVVDSIGSDSSYSQTNKDAYSELITLSLDRDKTSGTFGDMRYAVASLGFNDWYIIYMLPAASVNAASNTLLLMAVAIGVLLIGVSIFAFITYYNRNVKDKLVQLKISQTDALTGLLNYQGMRVPMAQRVVSAPPGTFAVVDTDIDSFERFNALYGYEAGDKAIKNAAQLLKSECSENELICRAGGERFLMLLQYRSEQEMTARIERLKNALSKTEQGYTLSFVFGIYPVSDPFLPADTLRDRVSVARQAAKTSAERKYAFYDATLHGSRIAQARLSADLTRAINGNEYIPFFQPLKELESGKFVACEALARHILPDGTAESPLSFLPVFEKNGQSVIFDTYIFERVCKTLANLNDGAFGGMKMSVNFSASNMFDTGFTARITGTVRKYALDPKLFVIELTEETFSRDPLLLLSLAQSLHSAGFGLAIDKFGEMLSSIRLLSEIPAEYVKLDKSVTAAALDSERGKEILSGMISMTKSIGCLCVAQGVESEEADALLKSLGCTYAQGFLYAKPVSESDLPAILSGLHS
ncbi:MAG TPA: EAL domain-containing protein [Bacillota bacterium]|nr:EAL domain-containing protein [Bacillota bacterium]